MTTISRKHALVGNVQRLALEKRSRKRILKSHTGRREIHIFSEACEWDWEQLSGVVQQQYLERRKQGDSKLGREPLVPPCMQMYSSKHPFAVTWKPISLSEDKAYFSMQYIWQQCLRIEIMRLKEEP